MDSHETSAYNGLVHVCGCHGDDMLTPAHVPVQLSVVPGHGKVGGGTLEGEHGVGGGGEPEETRID